MAATAFPLAITVDVANDLKDGSHLKTLLAPGSSGIFSLGPEFVRFLGQPVRDATGLHPVKISVPASGSWSTSSGVAFSLSAGAACSIAVSDRSAAYSVARSIDSTERRDIVMGPAAGFAYINLELDFDIQGSAAASGTAGAVCISGQASGSAKASLSYCHRVDAGTETLAAIREAFSALAFPFQPDCALRMAAGDIGKVNFDGTLGFELSATYGLGSYRFSAPGVDSARQSLAKGFETFTPASLDIETGATATFSYTHQDHFGVIVAKAEEQTATIDLVRSASDEVDLSATLSVGVTVTGPAVTLNQDALAQAVNKVTRVGGAQVAALGDKLQSSLEAKTTSWLSNLNGDTGLLAKLARQTGRALLYSFSVDLSQADLATRSWTELAKGDLRAAMRIGGMKLAPGSGVSEQLRRSVTIGLHFFNLFSVTSVESYFQKSRTEIGPDGSVRFLFDVGKEAESGTKKATQVSRIHFVASAAEGDGQSVTGAEVDLYIELGEGDKPNEAERLAATIGSVPARKAGAVQDEIRQFAAAKPGGKVTVISILKPSAYQRIVCSPYTGASGDVPPPLPQAEDAANFNAFREAAERILGLRFVESLTYLKWQQFNLICNGGSVPDRRNPGNPNAVQPSFYGNLPNAARQAEHFLLSGARFLNLCDDLHALVGLLGRTDTLKTWDELLVTLTELVANDVQNDWSKPAASAIFSRFGGGGVQTDVQRDDKSLTCTVTLS
ncbi:MAG: hypothetical protein ABUS49_00700 [Acidobacteriota bacterium]